MLRHGIKIYSHKDATVLKAHWFDLNDGADVSIAIVLVKISDGHVRAYVGAGHDHRGEHRDTARSHDELYIAHWGAEVSRETAESIFGPIDNWIEKEV